jgi:hypothetical protein
MADYIGGDPPVSKIISLTKGADKSLTLRRKNSDGDPEDWAADLYMVVDATEPIQVDGVVTDDVAVFRIESDVCDTLTSQKWRIIMSQAGSPSLETALLRGKFQRND